MRERRRRRDHILGIAAIMGDAGHQGLGLARKRTAAAAGIAIAEIAAMPADPDPRSRRPAMDFGPDRIDCADDLVPRNARIFDIREQPLFGDAVAVADAAGLDLDP